MKHNTNDIVRLVHYVRVNKAYAGNLNCTDLERGFDFTVQGSELSDSVNSADSFETTEKVGITKIVEIFESVRENVFSVTFEKKDGSPRKLRGYMVKRETGMGRSMVIDLDLDKKEHPTYDNRLRQVDHRTISELIVDGVRYVVK